MDENKIIEMFDNGFDCGQIVLSEFSDKLNLTKKHCYMLASGFGGGYFSGYTCGAVNGAIVAIGLKYGFYNNNFEQKKKNETVVREFIEKFKNIHKSIICKDLLGYNIGTVDGYVKIIEKELICKLCPNFVKTSITIVNDLFDKYK